MSDDRYTESAYDDNDEEYVGDAYEDDEYVGDTYDDDEAYGDEAYGDDAYGETEAYEEDEGSWWDEGVIGLLLVAGVVLFFFPEPATSMIGIVLIGVAVLAWIVDALM